MPRIQSRDNPRLKDASRLLASARERRKTGLCVLEGVHLIDAFLGGGGMPEWVIVDEGALGDPDVERLVHRVAESRLLIAASAVFAEATHLASPSRVLAVAPTPPQPTPRPRRFALLLEEIQDPGNLGTVLRSAAAAGVEAVFMSKGCAFAWSPKVLRAGQGAHFHLPIVEDADLVRVAVQFPGRVLAAVVTRAPPAFAVDLAGPTAFAIGSEGVGLSAALRAACAGAVTIPMPGRFESLNAAVAASILLFEKVRQEALGAAG